jgi:anti-sigma factor RsiW
MAEHELPHPDVGGYVFGVLEPEEAAEFEEHLSTCAGCRHEVGDLSGVHELLGQAAAPLEVPPHLEERTLGAVHAAAEERD